MEGTGGPGTPCSPLLRGGIAAIVVATAVGCAQTPGAVPERDVEASSKGVAESSDPLLEAEWPALLNDRGRVRVGRYFGSDFPANLDGTSFSELLESVRSIAR